VVASHMDVHCEEHQAARTAGARDSEVRGGAADNVKRVVSRSRTPHPCYEDLGVLENEDSLAPDRPQWYRVQRAQRHFAAPDLAGL